MIIKKYSLIIIALLLIAGGCKRESPVHSNRVVIALSDDITSFNPLFSFSVDEGVISELLYLSLVDFTWDYDIGNIKPEPMLAKSWEWSKDSSSITFNLRNDVYWSDGRKFSAEDVVFSFDVYSDPDVQSRLYGSFSDFYTDSSNHIDIKKTFNVIDSFKVKINFKPNSTPTLPKIIFHLIPKHIFENVKRKDLEASEENFKPVTDGPFKLAAWNKNQTIVLKTNKNSFLHNPDGIDEMIFKIVPDYNSRITQLKKGEVDFVEFVKTEDISQLKKVDFLNITAQKGREYDYVAWNNIDYQLYNKTKKIKPNKFFGSPAVRIALTYGINRKEILDEYMSGHGQLAIGPVSPIFKDAIDLELKPYEYNPEKAKQLLASDGWKDVDNDGILEKGNLKFRFKLYIPSGNPRRNYAATVIKNNLKELGIDVIIETVELGVLIDNMYKKTIDAWMIGLFIAIPIDLKTSWYSDLEKTPYNFVSYRNPEVDKLLDKISDETDQKKIDLLYRKLQKIIHRDEPETFLYWVDNIVVYNKKIENIDINPLGTIQHCWNWTVRE